MHSGHTTNVNKHNPLSETQCTNPNKSKNYISTKHCKCNVPCSIF